MQGGRRSRLVGMHIVVAMVVVVRRYAGRHNVRLRLAELLLVEQYGANRRSRRCSRGTRSQNRIRLGGRTLVVPQRCSGWHLVTGGLQEPWITSRAARCRCSGHRHRGLRESAMVSDDRGLSVLRGSRVAVHSLAGRRGCRLLPQQSLLDLNGDQITLAGRLSRDRFLLLMVFLRLRLGLLALLVASLPGLCLLVQFSMMFAAIAVSICFYCMFWFVFDVAGGAAVASVVVDVVVIALS